MNDRYNSKSPLSREDQAEVRLLAAILRQANMYVNPLHPGDEDKEMAFRISMRLPPLPIGTRKQHADQAADCIESLRNWVRRFDYSFDYYPLNSASKQYSGKYNVTFYFGRLWIISMGGCAF